MSCSRASHFSHVSASRLKMARSGDIGHRRQMHSLKLEGWHGLAGWGFGRFPETSAGLRADDGGNSLPAAGSSLIAANLCLAELRSLPEISGAARLPEFLAGKT